MQIPAVSPLHEIAIAPLPGQRNGATAALGRTAADCCRARWDPRRRCAKFAPRRPKPRLSSRVKDV